MESLAKHIRKTLFELQMQEMQDVELDEDVRCFIDDCWIDKQERQCQSMRDQRQRLAYLATEPPTEVERQAAIAFINTMFQTPAHLWIERWEASYRALRDRHLAHIHRLTLRQKEMDVDSVDFSRCTSILQQLHRNLHHLPLHVKNDNL